MSTSSRWHRWGRWVVLGTVMTVVLVLVTGWLLFQHIPSWYRPVEVSPSQRQAVRDDLAATSNGLNVLMSTSPGPFEYRFTQDQINAWLAAREDIWPLSREWLPAELSDPFLAIESGGVRLAVTFQQGSLRTVLNAQVEMAARPDGIHLRLDDVSAGGLPSPKGWLRDQLAHADRHGWPAGRRVEGQYGPGAMPSLAGLLDGITLPNGWIWPTPERAFRITTVTLEPGAITIRFEPRPLQASSR